MLRIHLKGLILPKGICHSVPPILKKKKIIATSCGRFSSELAVIGVTKCELEYWLREMH